MKKSMNFLFLLVLFSCTGESKKNVEEPIEMVKTPFGEFPSQCVFHHPEGTVLENVAEGVKATHLDGTTKIYPHNDLCEQHYKSMQAKKEAATNGTPNGRVYLNAYSPDNTGITSFSADYQVPRKPKKIEPSSAFSYWLGLQDPGSPVPNPNTVLQPVMAFWGPDSTWNLEPWHCCIKGQAHSGPFIKDVPLGTTATGKVEQLPDGNQYKISFKTQTDSTSLITTIEDGAIYNWMLFILEANESSCDLLPDSNTIFTNVTISNANGTVTPDWVNSDDNSCINIKVTGNEINFYKQTID